GGVALIDYDGAGLLDVFATGGGYFTGPDHQQIAGYPNRLFKNLGGWKFKDVTKEVGLDQPVFYSHGCAVGDYDRDGWPDLLVTGWDRLALDPNEPDGAGGRRFAPVTQEAGPAYIFCSTRAGWADLDADGYPDLYVCNYLNWSFANHPRCGEHGRVDVCPPKEFHGLPHVLYRNNRDGTFTDVSRQAGLRPASAQASKGL